MVQCRRVKIWIREENVPAIQTFHQRGERNDVVLELNSENHYISLYIFPLYMIIVRSKPLYILLNKYCFKYCSGMIERLDGRASLGLTGS